MVRGLAMSMTAGIRNKPYDGLDDEHMDELHSGLRTTVGSTLVAHACVYVHWLWVAYPVALLLLQWAFCSLVLASRRSSSSNGGQQRMAWKSSSLALSFNGLENDVAKRHSGLYTLEKMNQVAKGTTVKIATIEGSKDEGMRFYETKA
ncbi:hypothetical protein CSAL01_03206 [Colletotrichum salicis]|uniref:Uncharacterized protein n=1 Tax=Colletotrichum salicis TaxID=1209931 RepID=A0A135U8Q8_9PEZI|nr:hypothetical protein CSAL01_03206 [Colletotrichum salicis]